MAAGKLLEFIPRSRLRGGPARVGTAAVIDALEGIEFPADLEAVLRRAGDQVVELRAGEPLPLADTLRRSRKPCFGSMIEIARELEALQPFSKRTA